MAQVPAATTAQAFGRQPVDPVEVGDRLAGRRIGAEGGPVALVLVLFVRDRAFDDQQERPQLPGRGVPGFEKIVAVS